MVYLNTSLIQLNKYLDKKLTSNEIKENLIDMGLDLKGEKELENSDTELKIELTSEKIDMISIVGVARALNYYINPNKKDITYLCEKSDKKVIVENSVKNVRGKIVCAIIKNFKLDEDKLNEIIDIQEKIHDSFGRNRKKVAIGIYPLKKISFPVFYKGMDPKTTSFNPLKEDKVMNLNEIIENTDIGKKFSHLLKGKDKYPILIDSKEQILSMPPIINSNSVGKVENDDCDLFVECTGENLDYLDSVLKVLITSFIEMGADCESVLVEYENGETYKIDLSNSQDKISLKYINSLIGIKIDSADIKKYFKMMQYNFISIENEDEITFEIPCFKSDVWNDCDVADDIARAYKYNNIVEQEVNINGIGSELTFSIFKNKIRDILINSKFIELYTYLLSSKKTQFENMNLDSTKHKFIDLKDSVDQGLNLCRINVLPELLTSLNINRQYKYPQNVFEVGMCIDVDETSDTKAKNCEKLSCVMADQKISYTDIKIILDLICNIMELDLKVESENFEFLINGRSAKILFNEIEVGFIGELNPKVIRNFGLLVPLSCLEIDIRKIFELINLKR